MSAPKVVAIVPLFDPDPSAAAGVRGLAEQVDLLVLVDDGSPGGVERFVAGVGVPSARLIRSAENRGIAHALNLGVEAAAAEGADFVLTSDQDSVLDPDYVAHALAASAALRASGTPFAAVAAGIVDGKPNPGREHSASDLRTTSETIQSGMLFPVEVLRRLGPFDETFFIDCVDTDYILRGVQHGLSTFLAPECRMTHAVGEGIAIRLPPIVRRRDRVVPFHAPVRRYYITRNRVRLFRRHARHSPRWAGVQTYEQVRSAVADLVWGADRRGLLRANVHGAIDGFRDRGGRIPVRLESRLRRDAPGPAVALRPGPAR